MKTETKIVNFDEIRENESNPRYITEGQLQKLTESLIVFPKMTALRPIVANEGNVILGGNMRYRAFERIKGMDVETLRKTIENAASDISESDVEMLIAHWQDWQRDPKIEITIADELDEAQTKEFVIKDNVNFGEWDLEKLQGAFDPERLRQYGEQLQNLPNEIIADSTYYDDDLKVVINFKEEQMNDLAKLLKTEPALRAIFDYKDGQLIKRDDYGS